MFLIHSFIGADSPLEGLITRLHYELAFSKAKDLINNCLASESDTIQFTAEINPWGKKERRLLDVV